VAEGALDVVAPNLARQFVQHLDPVAVRVADIETAGASRLSELTQGHSLK
jgi:hypothetical protein